MQSHRQSDRAAASRQSFPLFSKGSRLAVACMCANMHIEIVSFELFLLWNTPELQFEIIACYASSPLSSLLCASLPSNSIFRCLYCPVTRFPSILAGKHLHAASEGHINTQKNDSVVHNRLFECTYSFSHQLPTFHTFLLCRSCLANYTYVTRSKP